jgi:tRNA threonylcarbamoyladenosine biosynthesis protein TsaB
MRLLAIDSATDRLALAAIDGPADGAPRALQIDALDAPGGPAASAAALPGLMQLLARRGWAFSDLDAIAFGRGPGGFTGLRTACAVAQGLAFGAGIPVLAIDSLALVAEDAFAQAPARAGAAAGLWVAMDARMDEVYAAAYRRDAQGDWALLAAPALLTVAALAARWAAAPPALVAGTALAAFGDRLPVGEALQLRSEGSRAQALARLAARALARGESLPAAQALPVYLRDKVAQTTAERAAARAAAPARG